MKTKRFILIALLALVVLALASPALAHERRQVDKYLLVFGWRTEPAFTLGRNGPELYIYVATADTPADQRVKVTDATIHATVTLGDAHYDFDMRPAFNDPGHYIADLIPTQPGDYSFHITGTIEGMAVDETFTSADGHFGSVDPSGDIQFPQVEPNGFDLEARVAALEATVSELQAKLQSSGG